MKRSAICVAAAVLVAGCATSDKDMAEKEMSDKDMGGSDIMKPDGSPMGQPSVEAMFGAKTEAGTTMGGKKYAIYWSPDGTARGMVKGAGSVMGTWTVKADGRFCRTFDEWRNGTQGCWKVYGKGDNLIMIASSGNAKDRKLPKSALKVGNPRGF